MISIDKIKQLRQPHPQSHKGQNGILYIVAGSKQYHGSLWYAVEAACHFVDLIYVETDPSNQAMVRSLKQLHPAIILVSPRQRAKVLFKSDCVLLGPGLGRGQRIRRLVQTIMQHPQRPSRAVIDADGLYYVTLRQMTKTVVVTPHAGEYKIIFGTVSPRALSQRLGAVIVAKSARTQVCQSGRCWVNTQGNAGLTKGGTGDALAGLIAALYCTNSALLASTAAVQLVGLAAQRLAKTHGTHFSTREMIATVPLVWRYVILQKEL